MSSDRFDNNSNQALAAAQTPDAGEVTGKDSRETEFRSPRFQGLDTWGTGEVLAALLAGQHQGLHAVWGALQTLEQAVAMAVQRLSSDEGRIIYVGAGTSGRLAVLDGIELTPTFGWPPQRLVYLFAGGEKGLIHSIEGAEDDAGLARDLVERTNIGPADVVLALAASGTTPYTRAAVAEARKKGALTISFANNPGSPLLDDAQIGVLLRSGPEVLAGSTRLGAGTAQKVALNLFSTALMVGLNKVYAGYMVDMVASNEKLKNRAAAMVMELTRCDAAKARAALEQTDYGIKLAVLLVGGMEKPTAEELLERHNGNLGAAIKSNS
jgi:N-acetylmuramic acid 6-phosphate etherase